MKTNSMKISGSVVSLVGGIIAFFSSFTHFFTGRLITNTTYNSIGTVVGETLTVSGVFIFVIAIAVMVLSLISFKHHHVKGVFVALIVLGIALLILLSYISGVLTLLGGILGLIGIIKISNKA